MTLQSNPLPVGPNLAGQTPVGQTPIGQSVEARPLTHPERITLTGKYVHLVPLEAAHAQDLLPLASGPGTEHLWTYMPDGPFADAAVFRAHIESKAKSADPLFFAIIDQASRRAVGHATLMRIDPVNRVIEVGNILYTGALQRTVGATEAMYLMARYVFDTLGYRRYEWKCNSLNAPSIAAARRLGFTYEGLFRQHLIIKGRNRDTAWFSMLDHEWPARKAAFEAWLDPANFDAAGRQRRSLADCAGA